MSYQAVNSVIFFSLDQRYYINEKSYMYCFVCSVFFSLFTVSWDHCTNIGVKNKQPMDWNYDLGAGTSNKYYLSTKNCTYYLKFLYIIKKNSPWVFNTVLLTPLSYQYLANLETKLGSGALCFRLKGITKSAASEKKSLECSLVSMSFK